MTIVPNCLTREAYTYSPEHRCGSGWSLFDEHDWPTIQRLDEAEAFHSDAEAAFHVLCVAAFDASREGDAAREVLRGLIRFGEQGLNPIATMLAPRQQPDKTALAIRLTHASTHVLLSNEDLAILEQKLGPKHDITTRVRDQLAELADPAFRKYRTAAMRHGREGDLEVDPHAVVSKGSDPGAYVMTWLWISDEEAGVSAP